MHINQCKLSQWNIRRTITIYEKWLKNSIGTRCEFRHIKLHVNRIGHRSNAMASENERHRDKSKNQSKVVTMQKKSCLKAICKIRLVFTSSHRVVFDLFTYDCVLVVYVTMYTFFLPLVITLRTNMLSL